LDILTEYSGDIREDAVDTYITLPVDLTDDVRQSISSRVLAVDTRCSMRRYTVLRIRCVEECVDIPSIQTLRKIMDDRLQHVTYTDSILDIPNSFQYPQTEVYDHPREQHTPETDVMLRAILELNPNFNVDQLHTQAWIYYDLQREVNSERDDARYVHGFWIIPELIKELRNTSFRYRGTYMSIMASDRTCNILPILQNLGCQKIHRCADTNHVHLNISIIPRRVLSCMYLMAILDPHRSIVI